MTPRQKQLYDYLSHYLATNQGVAPSFDQMKEALGLASKSRIRILLNALEEQSLIWTTPNRARRIEIVRRPVVSEARPPLPVIVKSSVNLGAMASHIVAQPWCSADVETVLNSLWELKQGVAA